MGINDVDTSSSYSRGNSDRMIGKIIEGRRDKFYVATKIHAGRRWYGRSDIKEVEGSLTRLRVHIYPRICI